MIDADSCVASTATWRASNARVRSSSDVMSSHFAFLPIRRAALAFELHEVDIQRHRRSSSESWLHRPSSSSSVNVMLKGEFLTLVASPMTGAIEAFLMTVIPANHTYATVRPLAASYLASTES